jgi:hypothetical protein
MNSAINVGEVAFRLTLGKQMTSSVAKELEDTILDALRRHRNVEVDLSRVEEIDIYGTHLLGLLESFFGKGLSVVDSSPSVDNAFRRYLSPLRIPTRPPRQRERSVSAM